MNFPVHPSESVDLRFVLHGRAVPFDYADKLWAAIRVALPWFADDLRAGIHPLHGVSPGENEWYLSRRSRLVLRLAREQAAAAQTLVGAGLDLGEARVEVGAVTVHELLHMPVLHAKFVTISAAGAEPIAENDFLAASQQALAALDMVPQMICGRARRAHTPAGLLSGFSLMLFGLDAERNMRLQREGLGGGRKHGCGIFVPHKSIAAVGTLE